MSWTVSTNGTAQAGNGPPLTLHLYNEVKQICNSCVKTPAAPVHLPSFTKKVLKDPDMAGSHGTSGSHFQLVDT
jgi:hypothetical protein